MTLGSGPSHSSGSGLGLRAARTSHIRCSAKGTRRTSVPEAADSTATASQSDMGVRSRLRGGLHQKSVADGPDCRRARGGSRIQTRTGGPFILARAIPLRPSHTPPRIARFRGNSPVDKSIQFRVPDPLASRAQPTPQPLAARTGIGAPLAVVQPQALQRHARPGPYPAEGRFRVRRPQTEPDTQDSPLPIASGGQNTSPEMRRDRHTVKPSIIASDGAVGSSARSSASRASSPRGCRAHRSRSRPCRVYPVRSARCRSVAPHNRLHRRVRLQRRRIHPHGLAFQQP